MYAVSGSQKEIRLSSVLQYASDAYMQSLESMGGPVVQMDAEFLKGESEFIFCSDCTIALRQIFPMVQFCIACLLFNGIHVQRHLELCRPVTHESVTCHQSDCLEAHTCSHVNPDPGTVSVAFVSRLALR